MSNVGNEIVIRMKRTYIFLVVIKSPANKRVQKCLHVQKVSKNNEAVQLYIYVHCTVEGQLNFNFFISGVHFALTYFKPLVNISYPKSPQEIEFKIEHTGLIFSFTRRVLCTPYVLHSY
jgi:hypothetical protein